MHSQKSHCHDIGHREAILSRVTFNDDRQRCCRRANRLDASDISGHGFQLRYPVMPLFCEGKIIRARDPHARTLSRMKVRMAGNLYPPVHRYSSRTVFCTCLHTASRIAFAKEVIVGCPTKPARVTGALPSRTSHNRLYASSEEILKFILQLCPAWVVSDTEGRISSVSQPNPRRGMLLSVDARPQYLQSRRRLCIPSARLRGGPIAARNRHHHPGINLHSCRLCVVPQTIPPFIIGAGMTALNARC